MAQDFYAAFGLGNTDLAYNPIDAHGVALAAVKRCTSAAGRRTRASSVWSERIES